MCAALPGAAAGAIAGGWLADRIGRIKAMQIAAVLFTISGIGSMFAFQPWDLTIWRILGGFAIGIASVIGPAYIAEVSPPAFRGRLTGSHVNGKTTLPKGQGITALLGANA